MNALLIKLLLAIVGVGAVIGGYEAWAHHERTLGEALQREKNQQDIIGRQVRELALARAAAAETDRRLKAQQENQYAQDKELAVARADAARAERVSQELRHQNAGIARQWADRLASDSATREDREAAGAAIGVCSDLLGKSRERSRVLAAYADTARAAGLLCERNYDSLTAPVK